MKKIWRSTIMTGLLFVLAFGLLFAGTIGGTQAALQVFSDNYYPAFDLDHIGVALVEGDGNGNYTPIAWRTYTNAVDGLPAEKQNGELTLNLGSDKSVNLGKQYSIPVAAQNTGTIDQYVRVTVYKYWVKDASANENKYFSSGGTKIINDVYRPDYIQLGYNGGTDNYNSSNWILDPSSSTSEREVYYYRGVLNPGATTAPLFNNLSISSAIAKDVVYETSGNTTTYRYAYDGYGFVVEAEVDAVQTHHAWKAITSAWGTSSAIMSQMGITKE